MQFEDSEVVDLLLDYMEYVPVSRCFYWETLLLELGGKQLR